jgi:signal transduction histidine kinase
VVTELQILIKTLCFTDPFKGLNCTNIELQGVSSGKCVVKMNKVDFQQLITNLCKNAVEAIDHDHPHIIITTTEVDDQTIIEVEDNGRGIDMSLGKRIFEAYFSTKEGKSDHNQGLGLAMVRDILKSYGGTITYTSQPGRTVFTIALPCN